MKSKWKMPVLFLIVIPTVALLLARWWEQHTKPTIEIHNEVAGPEAKEDPEAVAPPCYCILKDEAGNFFIQKQIMVDGRLSDIIFKFPSFVKRSERAALKQAWELRRWDVEETTNRRPAGLIEQIMPQGNLVTLHCNKVEPGPPPQYDTASFTTNNMFVTNYNYTGSNFLTLEGRDFVELPGTVIVHVTDAEWNLITNHYATRVGKNDMRFFGPVN